MLFMHPANLIYVVTEIPVHTESNHCIHILCIVTFKNKNLLEINRMLEVLLSAVLSPGSPIFSIVPIHPSRSAWAWMQSSYCAVFDS